MVYLNWMFFYPDVYLFRWSKLAKMSKMGVKQQLKGMRKVVQKVVHGNRMEATVPAGMASAGPPLGPTLGQVCKWIFIFIQALNSCHVLMVLSQRGINVAAFCKDFNERTKDMKEGVPLPCRITVNSDRSYELVIHNPPSTFFIKQAAGIQRGAMEPGII